MTRAHECRKPPSRGSYLLSLASRILLSGVVPKHTSAADPSRYAIVETAICGPHNITTDIYVETSCVASTQYGRTVPGEACCRCHQGAVLLAAAARELAGSEAAAAALYSPANASGFRAAVEVVRDGLDSSADVFETSMQQVSSLLPARTYGR